MDLLGSLSKELLPGKRGELRRSGDRPRTGDLFRWLEHRTAGRRLQSFTVCPEVALAGKIKQEAHLHAGHSYVSKRSNREQSAVRGLTLCLYKNKTKPNEWRVGPVISAGLPPTPFPALLQRPSSQPAA